MALSGHRMAISGNQWHSAALGSTHRQSISDEGGHQIHSAAISGNPSLMKEAIRSTQRQSAAIHGNQWRARTEKERIPNCRSPLMSGTSFNNAITRPKRLKKPTGAQQRSGSDDQPSAADGSEPAAAAATEIACAQKPQLTSAPLRAAWGVGASVSASREGACKGIHRPRTGWHTRMHACKGIHRPRTGWHTRMHAPDGDDAGASEERKALETEGRRRVERAKHRRAQQRDAQRVRREPGMPPAEAEGEDESSSHEQAAGERTELARGQRQVGFVDAVNLDVEQLVEAGDVHVHEQRGGQGVQHALEQWQRQRRSRRRRVQRERRNAHRGAEHSMRSREAPEHAQQRRWPRQRNCDVSRERLAVVLAVVLAVLGESTPWRAGDRDAPTAARRKGRSSSRGSGTG